MPRSPLSAPSSSETILALLYQGERIRISFPSPSLRETFRKRVYTRKAAQDEVLVLILEEKRKVLRCKKVDFSSANPPAYQLILWFEEERSTVVSFEVVKEESAEGEEESTEGEVKNEPSI